MFCGPLGRDALITPKHEPSQGLSHSGWFSQLPGHCVLQAGTTSLGVLIRMLLLALWGIKAPEQMGHPEVVVWLAAL